MLALIKVNDFKKIVEKLNNTFKKVIKIKENVFLGINNGKIMAIFNINDENITSKILVNKNIKIYFNKKIEVNFNERKTIFNALIIELLSDDKELSNTFHFFILNLINYYSEVKEKIVDEVNKIWQLFEHTDVVYDEKTANGLFGEFLTMYFFKIKYNKSIIKFWHSKFNNLFDFEFTQNSILEVKCTANNFRIHAFKHDQIFSTRKITKYISSVILSKRDKGLSLYDFSLKLKEVFKDYDFTCKVDTLLFKFRISEFKKGPCIDFEETISNIKIYNSCSIPQIQEIPNGIKNLKYDINLENIESVPEHIDFSFLIS